MSTNDTQTWTRRFGKFSSPGDVGINTPLQDQDSLFQSRYNFEHMVFPSDINMDDIGHYMIINISVPTRGPGLFSSGNEDRSSLNTNAGPRPFPTYEVLPDEYPKVDVLRFGKNPWGISAAPFPFSFTTGTRRIAQSIALFMPQEIVYQTNHDYEQISLTSTIGGDAIRAAGALGGGLLGTLAGSPIEGMQAGIHVGESLSNLLFEGPLPKLAGHPINPSVQVMFRNTNLRRFTFSFLFAPKSEEEAINVQRITRVLRYHSSPEVNKATYGFTYIPPAVFDLTFMNKGQENLNLPRIDTCVIVGIQVDHNPLGANGMYSTFHDGHPVLTRMILELSELEPISKNRVLSFF